MANKRPFVDGRIEFHVLFKGRTAPLSEMGDGKLEKVFNESMNRNGIGLYTRNVTVKDRPPQVGFITNETRVGTDTVRRVGDILKSRFKNMGIEVQRVDVVAAALSPGDKVRNAMGV